MQVSPVVAVHNGSNANSHNSTMVTGRKGMSQHEIEALFGGASDGELHAWVWRFVILYARSQPKLYMMYCLRHKTSALKFDHSATHDYDFSASL